MQFVDQAFARRLESAEEVPQVDCARMLQKLRPEIGADFAPICGGHMMFAGVNSPIGHAAGLGFDGPVTAADLDRLETFYRSHSAPAQLDICPLTDLSVLELVSARAYGVLELNNVLYRPIDSQEKFDIPKGIEIRQSNSAEADVFSDLLTRSFFDRAKPPANFADMLARCSTSLNASPSSRPPTAFPSRPPLGVSFPSVACLLCSVRARCRNIGVAESKQLFCALE
jgi:hypothetical protein